MNVSAAKADSGRTRSRLRIGSDDARAWVRKLRLHNPYAKSILMAVANYMNEDGAAYPGITTLAQDTDINEDTVISRLRWCESIGIIALFKCWIDENGRRNFDGRGRVTSSEIRFIFDIDPDEIELVAKDTRGHRPLRGAALASHESKAVNPRPCGEQTDESSYRPGRELNPVSPGLAPGQPPTPAARTEEPEEQKDSPLPPKGGIGTGDFDQEGSEPAGEASQAPSPHEPPPGWLEFERSFTADSAPILRQSIARGLFAALTEAERELVTTAARGLMFQRSRDKKPGAKPSAQTFLREIDAWPGYAKLAPEIAQPPTFIVEHSREYEALLALYTILGEAPPQVGMNVELGQRGFLRRHPVPLDLLGLANFQSKPVEQWTPISKDDHPQQLAAWCQRIEKWTGRRPELRRIETGGEHPFEWNGKTTMVKNFIMGLRVPCLFPPLKDGTISTGPPASSAA